MPPLFEELDYCETDIGTLSLRRRRDLRLNQDVYEIKLGEEFLMSSSFTASEVALADLGLAACEGKSLDVVVGGLGLGYTAEAALKEDRLRDLLVVEKLRPVIDWHESGLLPLGPVSTGDSRCRLVEGDFFAMAGSQAGLDPDTLGRRFDAVLVDIDHSPDFFLNPANEAFYSAEGLSGLRRHLRHGGVFGLWSNDAPDDGFTARLSETFAEAWAKPVIFHNPLHDLEEIQTVYLARRADPPH